MRHAKLPACSCPNCGKNLDQTTCLADRETPEPGDLTICIGCAEVLEFGPDMALHITDSKHLDADYQESIKMAQERIRKMNEKKRYEAQLNEMLANARKWRKANSNREALITFPAQVCIIGPISLALKHNVVRSNEAGLELLKALWPWDRKDEPTVLMCRIVLEHEI